MQGWTWAATSQRGTAHAANNEGRQDAYRILAVDDVMIAIVCDGAGSTLHGRLGAVVTIRMLSARATAWIDRYRRLPPPGIIEMWVAEVRLAIFVHAAARGCDMSEFAATLLLAISDGESTITAHIGDGAIVGRCAGAEAFVDLSWPESGEYASTTFFITDQAPHLRIGVMTGVAIDRIAVLSDGLERLALGFADRTAHQPFFKNMFKPLTASIARGRDPLVSGQLAAFLSSDSVNARTDDDKTLVLAALR
ncbi:PP2C family serine/threonine-protein phosphatase [Sphingomonas aerolata]|uniref:PP2C family serine/threonine-protein phosphatase n=1 Tax=Sphingomonas aerolata TaxID=185951 RepID=UPI002FDFCEE9